MQSDLADTQAYATVSNDLTGSSSPAAPGQNAQTAFETSAGFSQTTANEIPADGSRTQGVSSYDNYSGRRQAGGITAENLYVQDWAVNQNIVDVTPEKRSQVEDILNFGQELSSIRKEALNKLINNQDIFEPIKNFQTQLEERGPNHGLELRQDMTPAESIEFMAEVHHRNHIAQAELSQLASEISSEMNNRQVEFGVAVASYSWVKEMMMGAIKLVKNIISNTR